MRAVTTADYLFVRYGQSVAILFAIVGMIQMSVNIGVTLKASGALYLAEQRPWLVPAGRFLFLLGPWSMVEVFVIGVLVSLVKIGAMATVVLGLSFWAYVAFTVCFTASLSSLDRLHLWREIEAYSA